MCFMLVSAILWKGWIDLVALVLGTHEPAAEKPIIDWVDAFPATPLRLFTIENYGTFAIKFEDISEKGDFRWYLSLIGGTTV